VGCIGCGRDRANPDRPAGTLPQGGAVGPAIAVGGPAAGVSGIATGEGGVWVGGWGGRGGFVTRLDPRSGREVATARVPHGVDDVAAGAGAIWTTGTVCVGRHPDDPEDVCLTEPRVSRIDPESGHVATTIAIPLPPETARDTAHASAVAVGEGAVWAAVSWNATTGEVVRIDPRTNSIAARIPTGGFVGEMRLAAGSVWVLSHREYTDETKVEGASLLRIDPAANAIVATPIREELSLLGGTEHPPVMAAGDDAVWITSPTAPHPRLALRVDPQTNQVAREQLRERYFHPVEVEDDAIWFIGSTGRSAKLGRLDPQTLEETNTTELPISPVRAALDPETDEFWLASQPNRHNQHPKVVRVRVR
jgi:hypothetical protein